jgi:hemolysin III
MQAPPSYRGQVAWPYSTAELRADAAVHLLGVVLAISGAAVFGVMAAGRVDPPEMIAALIYLATLLLSISASAAYNIWPVSRTKWILRRLDHSAIYLLIAGTYTPFMVQMATWGMLALVWTIALFGVTLKLIIPGSFDRLSIGLYLALGWSGVATYDRLPLLAPGVVWLIVAGGLVYSLGVIFHVWERLRFQNVIWHSFVLVAAALHFAAVWTSIAAKG